MKNELFRSLKTSLTTHLPGYDIEDGKIEKMVAFVILLCDWGQRMNLTSDKTPEKLLERHLVDCLMPFGDERFTKPRVVSDIGSGAGMPAILWAIAEPDMLVYSIEKTGKKIEFQQHCVEQLALENLIPVYSAYLETDLPGKSDLVVSRAFKEHTAFLKQIHRSGFNPPRILFWMSRHVDIAPQVENYKVHRIQKYTLQKTEMQARIVEYTLSPDKSKTENKSLKK